MQEESTKTVDNAERIESTVATFRTFSPEKPVGNAVVYFWESHTNNFDDKEKHQATIELIYKEFDMFSCEKYEVRTGYLNRYNCLSKPMNESSPEEIEEAIIKGERSQIDWVNRCKPELPGFRVKNWQECISKDINTYFEACKKLIIEKIQKDKDFADAFSGTVNDYAERRETNIINGNAYMLEELSWILSLPLQHLNKPIYLIHVGVVGDAIRELFERFSNLQKAVKWLCPKIQKIVFSNKADFLLDYRNKKYFGYSYAMENKDIVKQITIFKKVNDPSKDEKNILYSIIERLPGHVYWLNRDNVYLGCNDKQAKDFGLRSRDDVVGKTNEMLHSKEEAEILDRINTNVMETGMEYKGDELVSFSDSRSRDVLTHKVPLLDISGNVIGLLGISIDITDRKRAEYLELQNRLQEIKIRSQDEFCGFTLRMAHDIVSPLKSLESFVNHCEYLKESDHAMLRTICGSIESISSDLLYRYEKDKKELYNSKEQDILVSLSLLDTVKQKEHQYKGENVEFKYLFAQKDRLAFIKGDPTSFSRMISNLMNNAVEAFEGKPGVVEIHLVVENKLVKIGIWDNGKGMSSEMVKKILNSVSVGTTKATGHGIGLDQVRDTLCLYNGKMAIASKEGVGTKITVSFVASAPPSWITDRVVFPKGTTVVVLDDDESMSGVWENLLRDYSNDLTLKFFAKAAAAEDFLRSSSCEKERTFVLTDYDLRSENNGLMVILANGMRERSLIVTSLQNASKMQEQVVASNIQILPKQFLDNIQIIVE
ncbi:MAG: PAS domain-containing sensor histidine kinase [Holosporaceae bacterium]|jgi:PAS domain S-box-containing protein|nr:PAS domain-containing sensor histidine kinase [Holosporaceae bacterium]